MSVENNVFYNVFRFNDRFKNRPGLQNLVFYSAPDTFFFENLSQMKGNSVLHFGNDAVARVLGLRKGPGRLQKLHFKVF